MTLLVKLWKKDTGWVGVQDSKTEVRRKYGEVIHGGVRFRSRKKQN